MFKKGSSFEGCFLRVIWGLSSDDSTAKNEVPARGPGLQLLRVQRELGSATLTIAVLILFFVLVLPALFGLVLARLTTLLAGLTAVLALSGLSRLTALLALSELVTLLTLLFHIVCHKKHSPKKARTYHAFEIEALSINLVAAGDCKGWEQIPAAAISI
ncbi:MAG: hypothetical protein ACYDDS_17770 [Candidatus Sulfotelmatobacter sp.]